MLLIIVYQKCTVACFSKFEDTHLMYFFTSLPPPIPLDPLSLPLSFSTSVIILSRLSVLLRSSASAFAPDILGLRCTTESANRNIDFDLIISFILGCLCTTWWQ